MPTLKRSQGFSLIEVLVAIVIISIGILGLVAMQGRTIQYTQDSAQRNTAAMLADDLIELIRSNRDGVVAANGQLKSTSNYYKAASANFTSSGVSACRTSTGCSADEMATDHLSTWVQQVRNSLPVDDATLADFVICLDSTPDTAACDNLGSAIKIQIAWLSRNAECAPNTPCTNAGEVDSTNSREFYRISFEP